jgi:hypothetical protein
MPEKSMVLYRRGSIVLRLAATVVRSVAVEVRS